MRVLCISKPKDSNRYFRHKKKSECSESPAGRSFIIIYTYSYYLNVHSIQVALICNKLQPYVTKNLIALFKYTCLHISCGDKRVATFTLKILSLCKSASGFHVSLVANCSHLYGDIT